MKDLKIDNNIIQEQEDTIDIKKFVFKILSNWYWFVLTVFLASSLAYFINKYTDPVYSIQASILVRDKSNSMTSGVDNILNELGMFKRIRRKNVENEIGILNSYTLARRTIEELDFQISYFSIGRIREPENYKEAPFYVVIDTNKINIKNQQIFLTLKNTKSFHIHIDARNIIDKDLNFGESLNTENYNFTVYSNGFSMDSIKTNEYYFIINDINILTNRYKSKIKIETSDKKSSILYLTTTGKVVQKEVDYLNKLCDEYIQMDLDEKNEISHKTIKFIDKQLDNITDSLRNVENNLQDFKESNKTMDLSIEGQSLYKKLEKLENSKAEFVVKNNYYNYLIKYIKSKNITSDIIAPSVMGINDEALNKLVVQLNTLASEKSSISYGSTDKNPAINMYDNQIENLTNLILENINSTLNSSNIVLTNLEQRISKVDKEIRKLPITEKRLINIKRKFALNDEIYTFLLQKRAETGIAEASISSENKILDYSRVDNAKLLSPKIKLNYIIAIIIALLIPLMFIIVIDFFDNKIHERKDIERKTNIPIIAEIGHNNKNSDLAVFDYPRSSISESFRKLRTNLKYVLIHKQDGPIVISVTSTISGEGKTFTAINTASVIAALGKKTIILGLDLRKPTLHKYFDFENENGISEYLTHDNDYNSIIRPTQINNLSVILAGAIPPNPAELIELPEMEELIQKLKKDYDYIILDTPPVALVTDALLLSSFVDINLYVIRQNYSNTSVIEFINEISLKNEISLNIIINDINISGYYSYKYNYNYKYGGGYYSHNYYDEDYKMPFIIKLFEKLKKKRKTKKA